jgi:glycosyltransferase involved in cell wall biosynthesis
VWQPFEELERRGYIAEWAHKDQSDKVLPLIAQGRYDAVITPRIVWPVDKIGDRWINAIHRAGLAWIYEADDDFYSPRIVERQMRVFEKERAKGFDALEWERNERIRLLAKCDGVTVSSPRLATVVRRYAPSHIPVYTIPNAIDTRWFKEVLRGVKRVIPPLTVGWAGGQREHADILPLAEAWAIVAKRYPHVNFVIQGYIPKPLNDSIPADRRHTLPWLPLQEYPRAMLNTDIACCAVAPLVFNTAKTCIKWYEFTMARSACVVSPTLYGREVTDGKDALVAETSQEWAEQIGRLIEDETLRRSIRRNARRKVVTEHSLHANWWRWLDAWADAVDRFRSRPQLALPA